MRFSFIKCHGSGNDFPLIDARGSALGREDWAVVARVLSDRAGPVGSDGLLLLTGGDETHDFGMAMYNADGSEAEVCLNGLRCVARAGFEALGFEALGMRARVRLMTSSAEVARGEPLAPGVYTVSETTAPASLDAGGWPLGAHARVVDAVVPETGSARRFTAVAIPNPHLIAFVERIDEEELSALGKRCEAAPAWLPNRANVSFVVTGADGLFVRTFERGVGLTASCGSAMASATYAACVTGRWRFGTRAVVRNAGGLVLAEAGEDGVVTLWGNATREWAGTIDIDPVTGAAGAVVVSARYDDEIAAWKAAIGEAAIGEAAIGEAAIGDRR